MSGYVFHSDAAQEAEWERLGSILQPMMLAQVTAMLAECVNIAWVERNVVIRALGPHPMSGPRLATGVTADGDREVLGVTWLRWSDAVRDAGYGPNEFSAALSEEHLVEAVPVKQAPSPTATSGVAIIIDALVSQWGVPAQRSWRRAGVVRGPVPAALTGGPADRVRVGQGSPSIGGASAIRMCSSSTARRAGGRAFMSRRSCAYRAVLSRASKAAWLAASCSSLAARSGGTAALRCGS